LNNDQRRSNVKDTMMSRAMLDADTNVLLIDDYTGSGATLKEAVTTLRKQAGVKGDVVPLCVASVRWRLGKAGIV
jgi:ATP-dependent DNA helicase RecQ